MNASVISAGDSKGGRSSTADRSETVHYQQQLGHRWRHADPLCSRIVTSRGRPRQSYARRNGRSEHIVVMGGAAYYALILGPTAGTLEGEWILTSKKTPITISQTACG